MGNPNVVMVSVTPTITSGSAYASGNLLGTKMTVNTPSATTVIPPLSNMQGVVLTAIGISDLSTQACPVHVVLFDQDPSGTTFTDRSALDIADADLLKIVAFVPLTAYTVFADNCYGYAGELSRPIPLRSGGLYACLVAQAAATYTSTTDITIKFEFTAANNG